MSSVFLKPQNVATFKHNRHSYYSRESEKALLAHDTYMHRETETCNVVSLVVTQIISKRARCHLRSPHLRDARLRHAARANEFSAYAFRGYAHGLRERERSVA